MGGGVPGRLPRRVFDTLNETSVQDPAVRGLVHHVIRQRAEARATGVEPAAPVKLRSDLMTLLRGLDEQARTGRLPSYVAAVATGRRGAPAAGGAGRPRFGQIVAGPHRNPLALSGGSCPPRRRPRRGDDPSSAALRPMTAQRSTKRHSLNPMGGARPRGGRRATQPRSSSRTPLLACGCDETISPAGARLPSSGRPSCARTLPSRCADAPIPSGTV
jgi:hypothetical protein